MTLLATGRPRPVALPDGGVEALLAAALAASAVVATGPRPLIAGLLWLALVTPRLIAIDQAEHRLPDAIVLPGVPIAALAAVLDAAVGASDLRTAVLSAVLYAGVLLALHVTGGVGLGDVKLALPLGLLAGAAGAGATSPLLALLVGGGWSAVVLVRAGRGARIPFGPAMLLGCWSAVLLA